MKSVAATPAFVNGGRRRHNKKKVRFADDPSLTAANPSASSSSPTPAHATPNNTMPSNDFQSIGHKLLTTAGAASPPLPLRRNKLVSERRFRQSDPPAVVGGIGSPIPGSFSRTSPAVQKTHSAMANTFSPPRHVIPQHHASEKIVTLEKDLFMKRFNKSGKKAKQRHDVYDSNEAIQRSLSGINPRILSSTPRGMKMLEQISRIQQGERINHQMANHVAAMRNAKPKLDVARKSSRRLGDHTAKFPLVTAGVVPAPRKPPRRKPMIFATGPSGKPYTVRASGKRQYYPSMKPISSVPNLATHVDNNVG